MEVIRITEELLSYLDKHDKITGNIHSVFEGAFNILDENNRLIGVLSSKKDLSPFSLQVNTDSFGHKSLEQGQSVALSKYVIAFDKRKLKFHLSSPDKICLKVGQKSHYKAEVLRSKLMVMKKLIIDCGSDAGISGLIRYINFGKSITCREEDDGLNDYSIFIRERLIELLQSTMTFEMNIFLSHVKKIVGFGPGLTPSSDDFLSGMIIVMHCMKLLGAQDIHKIYEICVGKTTTISEEMIHYTTLGYVSNNSKILIESLFDDDEEMIENEIINVMQIGSTSGTDFLFGVYCMASLILEREA